MSSQSTVQLVMLYTMVRISSLCLGLWLIAELGSCRIVPNPPRNWALLVSGSAMEYNFQAEICWAYKVTCMGAPFRKDCSLVMAPATVQAVQLSLMTFAISFDYRCFEAMAYPKNRSL